MKRICLALLLLLLLALLVACGADTPPTPDTTEAETTCAEAPESADASDSETVLSSHTVGFSELGMIPVRAEIDSSVATCEFSDGKAVTVTAVASGSTLLRLYDDFGNTVEITLSVSEKQGLTVAPYHPFGSGNALNAVLDCGAEPNDGLEDTAALQSGIDRLAEAGGGTLYVPRGVYLVKLLRIRDNVTLSLAGKVECATDGYTAEIKARVDRGEFAVLRTLGGDMMHSFTKLTKRPDGADNFRITGGVIDMQGTSRFILAVSSTQFTLENSILKDCPNNHAIQITGSSDAVMRNLLFAGYNLGSNTTTAEVLQVEAAANGATGGDLATYDEGESYASRDVRIEGCYFGGSDRFGAPHIAIGHHGTREKSDVDGLVIKDCTFHDVSLYAIKTSAFSNVEIVGNRFLSTDDAYPFENAAFICLTLGDKHVQAKLAHPETGEKISTTLARPYEMQGSHGIRIADNEFSVTSEVLSHRVIVAESNPYLLGAEAVTKQWRYTAPGKTALLYTGYRPSQNVIHDLSVTGNRIAITSTEAVFEDALMVFRYVVGLTIEGNEIDCTIPFYENYGGHYGILVSDSLTGADALTRTVRMSAFDDPRIAVILPLPSENLPLRAEGSVTLTLDSDGNGKIDLVCNEDGSLSVVCTANDGYVFDGWLSDGKPYTPTANVSLSSSLSLTAVFKPV